MTLRFLAGGAVHDIVDLHGVAKATFYKCLWKTLMAIDKKCKLTFPIGENGALEELEEQFSHFSNGVLRGFVGALDVIVIKIAKPSKDCVADPMSYYNRKGFFALNIQDICDADCRFLWFSAATVDSTHDSTAFSCNRLAKKLCDDCAMDARWSVAADEAYGVSASIVPPYSGSNLSPAKDAFNFYLSSCRIVIECAFGELVRRWGILWRKIELGVKRVPLVLSVCMKLHNICVQERLSVVTCFDDGRWNTPRMSREGT
jgi:hypothetical protein